MHMDDLRDSYSADDCVTGAHHYPDSCQVSNLDYDRIHYLRFVFSASGPQELTDKIINEVWDADDHVSHVATKTTLLVSRAWVNWSQSHLFYTVRFYTTNRQLRRWCNSVTPGPSKVSRHNRSLTIHARLSDGWFMSQTRTFLNVRFLVLIPSVTFGLCGT